MDQIKWRCVVCGYVHVGVRPPSHCPICGAGAGMFAEVKEAETEALVCLTTHLFSAGG